MVLKNMDLPAPELKQCWAQVSAYLERIIPMRTFAGKDADGKGFQPYSKSYLEYRKERGGTSFVNLKSVGDPNTNKKNSEHMVQSARMLRSDNKGMDFGLTGFNAEKAYANETRKDRVFLAVSEKEKEEIKKIVVKFMEL